MYHDIINTTYKKQLKELSPEKQFHFITRMALWNQDPWATQQIGKHKKSFLGGTNHADWQAKITALLNKKPDYAHINHSSARKSYFEVNPGLYGLELSLFQVMHAHYHFSVDLSSYLPDKDIIKSYIDKLLSDPRALGTLSTYLVDIFYLYYRFLSDNDKTLIPSPLLQKASGESPSTQLAVYLMTHCIIGETLFYNRQIPKEHQNYYQDLIIELNTLAEANWNDLTLDNRLEIALCNQITKTSSPLINQAIEDADLFFSRELGYILDPQKPDKNTLGGSEHRNVLYLMVTCRKKPEQEQLSSRQ